ncbi:DUF3800 domain-containing protein [Pseudonocardia xinjiangensis]|uniref:DUF3800 domain-containing protein n=1 Tax=Pseudonocardia xinjiangensis TaxID=75289 RepID=A0ABX1RHY1_9PSEU|nr:DUF3800 domain-containing protein [Pseudonocardia xinjiangensis]NMH79000.1 DUF3800 domain-containing protein [Pseudonocardia xinjiangensis]
MWLAYVDESGDAGYKGSRTYTLGCVLVNAKDWPDVFDTLVDFRRFLRNKFGVLVRAEIKANYLQRGGGPLKGLNLGDGQRHVIYRQHMRLLSKLGLQAFAVVIEKEKIRRQEKYSPRDVAWEFLLQRLERLSTTTDTPLMVIHDEGDSLQIRKLLRKARRVNRAGSAFGTGSFNLPARLIIEDPVPRQSDQSYLLQLADMVAFAAYRRLHPPPSHRTPVCHSAMWGEIGTAIYANANRLAHSQGAIAYPGIVVWPK